jgi:hypothetical protein
VRGLLLAAALALPAAAGARTPVALLPATGSNVAPEELAAAADVLRAHLESTRRFEVVRAPWSGPPGAEPSARDAARAAGESGASLGVTLRLSRLGAVILARLGAFLPDGSVFHADELSALGPDDLDPALRRLAEGLARRSPARDLAEIDTVTAREARPLPKRQASYAGGLRLGALVPLERADPEQRTGVLGGLGLVGFFDARSWLADVSLDAWVSDLDFTSDPDRAFQVSTGLYLPFSRGDVAPYLGGALAFGYSKLGGDEGGSGLSARAVAGLLLGRLSDVSVRVEWGYFWNLYDEVERGTGAPVRVQGGTFSVVLGTASR